MQAGEVGQTSVLRAAIIGCGQIAGGYDERTGPEVVQTHVKAYQNHPRIKLTAVVDQDKQRARGFSARWGVPAAYVDVSEMLRNEKPEIVSVCTPDDTHAALLQMCLDAGSLKALWCEKPLTTDLDKAEAIVSACAGRGILLAVNYPRRWQSQMQRLKRALVAGEVGDIQKVVVYYSKGICHNGSHAIDLLLDWFGLPTGSCVHASHVDYRAEDPTVDALLQFGKTPVYLIGVDERAYSLFEIQILGTLGRVDVRSSGREIEWYRIAADAQFEGHRMLSLQETWTKRDPERTLAHVVENIVEAIDTGCPVPSNGVSALATLRVCCQLVAQTRAEFHSPHRQTSSQQVP